MKAVRFCVYVACAAAVLLLVVFAVRTDRTYLDLHESIKNRIESLFTNLPGDSFIRQGYHNYLRATNRRHINRVTFLTDGRLMMDTPESTVFLEERAAGFAELDSFLETRQTPLIYVRIPSKIENNSVLPTAFSDNKIVEHGDRFIQLISEHGIDTLDLYAEMIRESKDFATAFFLKDIHWTAETALWASGKIGAHLNMEYNFGIDESIWNTERYDRITYRNAFLGNEATFASARRAYEDITVLIPKFDAEFDFAGESIGVWKSGSFIDVFAPKVQNDYNERFDYMDQSVPEAPFLTIINESAGNNKKVLLIAESNGLVLCPIFSLGFQRLDFVYLITGLTPTIIWDILKANEYDAVILAVSDAVVSLDDKAYFEEDRLFLGNP